MSLADRLLKDMQDAMRAGDTLQRDTLRMVRAALRNEEVARRRALTEEEALDVLRREVKRREEALDLFRKGKRDDLVRKAEGEIGVIALYLPEPLSEEEVEQMAREAIAEVEASDARQMGQVMKVLMPRVKGRAEGRFVSEMVRKLLAQQG